MQQVERGVSNGIEGGITIGEGTVLVFGDLHLSSSYKGTHKDYAKNCESVMVRILEICGKTKVNQGLSGIVFLGDVFGVKERSLRDQEFRVLVTQFFQQLNSMAPVMSVRGNHDYGSSSEFMYFEILGLIKNPQYIDYNPSHVEVPEVRLHLVNYGNEASRIVVAPSGCSNVILAHNDFVVPGVDTWFGSSSIRLEKTGFAEDMDMLISGHIHNPYDSIVEATYGGRRFNAFYPGCPTRVSERYDECYYVSLSYNGVGTDVSVSPFGLCPSEEEFYDPKDGLGGTVDEESIDEQVRRTKLKALLEELSSTKIFNADLVGVIENIPTATNEAKRLAIKYLKEEMANA